MPTLGATIRAVRKHLKQTMAEFAETLGSEQSTISRYESGQIIPSKTVLILLLMLAQESDKRPFLDALGLPDASTLEARFQSSKQVLQHITATKNRAGRDLSVIEFADEAAQIISTGAPVHKAFIQLITLLRLHGRDRQFQLAVQEMLPYFQFVANQRRTFAPEK